MFLNKVLKRIRDSIARRDEDLRIRIGSQHVAQNRYLVDEILDLWDVEVRVFSQWGEDGILDYVLHRLSISKPRILELGAGSFSECNSRFLAHNRNASVYAVDLRDDLPAGLEKTGLMWRNTLFCEVATISSENVNQILTRAINSIGGVDVLSIDLDGNDYWILRAINLHSFTVVVLEYNPIFGSDYSLTVIEEEKSRYERHKSGLLYGASFKAMINLMKAKDFVFIGTNRVGNNAFFVKNGLESLLKLRLPRPSDAHKYLDWRCRESRDVNMGLTYLDLNQSRKLLQRSKLFDIESNKVVQFEDIFVE
jgi:hypothetical protein